MDTDTKIEPIEEINDSIIDVNIEQLIPNVIDNYIVTIFENHHTIVIPINVTGSQFKTWRKGRGGIFSKDVLNFSLGLHHGKYIVITGKNLNCIARIIDDEEDSIFSELKLIDGKIKDKSYMILNNIENGKKIFDTQRYINEKDMDQDDSSFITTLLTSQDDDIDHYLGSISLFTE